MQIKTDSGLVAGAEKNRSTARRILILGVGNILLKDEGVGVHVAEKLQKHNLPGNVEVIDGGTAGIDILLSQAGLDKLVVVDAMKGGKRPGTIYKLKLKADEKDRLTQAFSQEKQSKISLHQVSLLDALNTVEKINRAPEEIVIIGVEPGEVDCGLGLTERVKQKVPKVIREIFEEIKDDIHTK